MVFSSVIFLFAYLPVLFLAYFIVKNKRCRNGILLVASLLFYAWGEPKNVTFMLGLVVANYAFGILVEREARHAKMILILSIVCDLGTLFVFKYLNFATAIFNRISKADLTVAEIPLPIGISFFTFQIMSYVIDVYRKKAKAQRNIFDLALYISFFPQLIAGPIVRYIDIEKQINERRTTWIDAYAGLRRFMTGFSKKVLLADQLAPLVNEVFGGAYPSLPGHWAGIIAYTLQIYFDFSGYSDMAIGMGEMFGFKFLENFDYPYVSSSMREFWRRWHISLSAWFRDYVYIPLGGSRKGDMRTYVNLMIVFLLTGLWHGAGFNFIVWGLFHAFFLISERMCGGAFQNKLPVMIRHFYSLSVIMIGWVFFRADGLKNALLYIKYMFVLSGRDAANFGVTMNPQYWTCLATGIWLAVPHDRAVMKIKRHKVGEVCLDGMVMLTFLIAICYMIGSGYSPFLYFRF